MRDSQIKIAQLEAELKLKEMKLNLVQAHGESHIADYQERIAQLSENLTWVSVFQNQVSCGYIDLKGKERARPNP